jgi:hypothetical protein
LHDANCMGCHDTGIYTRKDRIRWVFGRAAKAVGRLQSYGMMPFFFTMPISRMMPTKPTTSRPRPKAPSAIKVDDAALLADDLHGGVNDNIGVEQRAVFFEDAGEILVASPEVIFLPEHLDARHLIQL